MSFKLKVLKRAKYQVVLAIPGSQKHCLLSEQGKVRLMGCQGQHDQVSIQSV